MFGKQLSVFSLQRWNVAWWGQLTINHLEILATILKVHFWWIEFIAWKIIQPYVLHNVELGSGQKFLFLLLSSQLLHLSKLKITYSPLE